MKEKIMLRYRSCRYIVEELTNRLSPSINTAITPQTVEDLLVEAKINKNLSVVIR